MSNWLNRVHADDKLNFEKEFEACFARKHDHYFCECRMQHKNGYWIWVEIRGRVIGWSDSKKVLRMLGTFADINERKTQEQERREVTKQLRFQNERLTNFAHIVSHNLLSHSGNMNMLLDVYTQEEDADEQRTLMNMMKINSINLYNTLRHLSEVVDIQSGRDKQVKQMYLKAEVLKVFETLSESIKEAKAFAEINIPNELEVNYPPAYLDSILLNLVSNCIKYRSPERLLQVTINAFKIGDDVQLIVADNGLGIDLNIHRVKLFGMYKTFHGNKNARGIGLFMIKNQIEVMGGTIDVDSEPGIGTTFSVKF
ncbi:sensor histidine kinase [Mucilaginibacter terrae]|uniref:histidine kinase n=1 Tax=Mucilaginibacter terrae TaxID=1955052 RepID=A0ABU3GQU4_9SPHI|nr:PAS domain-containing sensor histidine kinase [Mucilaginibacter terrae]MDT3402132.1 light-regulated signal transduction histidine kinase (bacteriophytochrome) [Mucilaginibacter terrae]